MMDAVRQWAFSLCAAAMACAVIELLLPSISLAKMTRLALSVFFLSVLIQPLGLEAHRSEISLKTGQGMEQAAMDLASFYAQYGDFSRLQEMGVDTSYLSQMQRAELADLYSGGSSGSSGGSRSSSGSSSSSGKPRLTYAQTLQAIEDGRITDSVISAYDYYMGDGAYEAAFGDDEGSGETGQSLSAAAQTLYRQLGSIPGLTEDNKTAMIEDYLDSGRITEEEADWLLDYLGY